MNVAIPACRRYALSAAVKSSSKPFAAETAPPPLAAAAAVTAAGSVLRRRTTSSLVRAPPSSSLSSWGCLDRGRFVGGAGLSTQPTACTPSSPPTPGRRYDHRLLPPSSRSSRAQFTTSAACLSLPLLNARRAKPASSLSIESVKFVRYCSNMSGSTTLKEALASNESWASSYTSRTPDFFTESAKGQKPKILWLGCSDSRVPESTILNLPPGAVFTHRNIANIFTANDLSSLSVIEYAVSVVGVQHVVVCGHTACGGVAAALANNRIGVIDAWLQPLRALRSRLVRAGSLDAGLSDAERSLRLVEENVREGVRVVRSNPNVIRAARERGATVHGLVYDLGTGKLRELEIEEDEDDVKARVEAHTCD